LRAIERHVGKGFFDIVLINNHLPDLPPDTNFAYVHRQNENGSGSGSYVRIHGAPLVDDRQPWRHNSERLAKAIMQLLEDSGRITG
jgi:hypothetical protein